MIKIQRSTTALLATLLLLATPAHAEQIGCWLDFKTGQCDVLHEPLVEDLRSDDYSYEENVDRYGLIMSNAIEAWKLAYDFAGRCVQRNARLRKKLKRIRKGRGYAR